MLNDFFKYLFAVFFTFLFCSLTLADVIHLKDGRKVEGLIVFQDSEKVSIKTKYGTIDFMMSDVEKIEKKKTTDQIYQEMIKNLNPRDTKQLLDIAKWCKKNNLIAKANRHLKQIISIDPNNEEARKMLGYVKFEGKWVNYKELKKLKEESEKKEKEAQGLVEYNGKWIPKSDYENIQKGLVQYKGKWVTPEEKERLEKNLVLFEGNWIPKEDAEKMKQGLFKVDGEWINKKEADKKHSSWENPWRLSSSHILIVTNIPHDMAEKFLAEGEGSYKKAKAVFKKEPDLAKGKLIVYLAADLDTYNMIGNQIGDEKSSNYPVFYVEESPESVPVSVTYFENETFSLGLIRHSVIDQFFRRINIGLKEKIPDWFIKGKATEIERFFHPKYISWSKKRLIKLGGPIKMKQFFGHFGYTEREILFAGFLFSFLDSKDLPDSIKERIKNVEDSVKKGKKINSSFSKLEETLIRAEKKFLSYYEKF